MTHTRTLVVMRHAKAESVPGGAVGGDSGRRLTDRGRADAEAAGRFLASVGAVPDHALVSAAERTQQTWQAVRDGSGSSAEADVSRAMYGASADDVLEALQQVDAGARCVVFVGHNPDAEVLAYQLSDGEGDDDVERTLRQGFPTATLAVYDVPGDWADLTTGAARVRHVHTARA